MAQIVMIYGQSGTGKSTSLRNFKKGEVSVINVSAKPFPFKADFATLNSQNYEQIKDVIAKSSSPSIVIDDATYLIVNEYMRNARITGYQKFTDMALNFWNLLQFCIYELPAEKIVYFIGHSEKADDGTEHFKTVGKMLDNTVVPEGYFTTVLKSTVKDGQYSFITHNTGFDTVKSPIGLFEEDIIPNDLKAVDVAIRNYYGLTKTKNEEKKQ